VLSFDLAEQIEGEVVCAECKGKTPHHGDGE
jgi:hypothetical protein